MEPTKGADGWLDGDAGPVVRQYAMTSGRTRSTRDFDLISIILATRPPAESDTELEPEAAHIIRQCQQPLSVAEIAAHLDLPAGTVKVLLGDLLDQRLIMTRAPVATTSVPNQPVLEAVINGLRSL
jgi:Protein of unknown function (DUF742)